MFAQVGTISIEGQRMGGSVGIEGWGFGVKFMRIVFLVSITIDFLCPLRFIPLLREQFSFIYFRSHNSSFAPLTERFPFIFILIIGFSILTLVVNFQHPIFPFVFSFHYRQDL